MRPAGEKIRVVVVDDSDLMRVLIAHLLEREPEIEVVATAADGDEGVKKTFDLHPHVLVTDMLMPRFDGLYVVKNVMKYHPIPIILLSSLEKKNTMVFDALKEGAIDFVEKPQKKERGSGNGYYNLSKLIKTVSGVKVKKRLEPVREINGNEYRFNSTLNYDIIAIGASTGGPGAIETIIRNLPASLTVPIVIAQHMPSHFIASFAARLNAITPLSVSVARHNERVEKSTVYIAPGTSNLMIVNGTVGTPPKFFYTARPFKAFNNPSIDCLFRSVAQVYGKRSLGVILTGMGKDGTAGMRTIRAEGGGTVVQDEASCVIYGMPKNVIDEGLTTHQINIHKMADFLMNCL